MTDPTDSKLEPTGWQVAVDQMPAWEARLRMFVGDPDYWGPLDHEYAEGAMEAHEAQTAEIASLRARVAELEEIGRAHV